jgi:hypothetical protein
MLFSPGFIAVPCVEVALRSHSALMASTLEALCSAPVERTPRAIRSIAAEPATNQRIRPPLR